ncbi:hypothetical protein D3OALGB2SA_3788 [Olavius algarvensis associated proteobacterium Delta 3]|nr:hypothetical protein D3OALGB2SA_3788 [Olavius algarvensis associated proteobacterium Delta 3]
MIPATVNDIGCRADINQGVMGVPSLPGFLGLRGSEQVSRYVNIVLFYYLFFILFSNPKSVK